MLYLLDKTTKTVKWNGVPLHEAISAIAKEVINGEFSLVVKYPITDSDIYKQIKEDMLIKANVPVIGSQLFRVKKPVEHNDYLELTCRHITEDIMTRSIRPFGNQQLGCLAALTNMLEHSKTDLAPFSFDSDITSRHTFNTEEDETLYSVLLDGKHSIVGTWEGELERNNYTLTVKRSRGQNRGVIISSHFNLDEYQRERSTENVVTRIYATSTFKEEGREEDTVLKVTVDSPLINQYPYINEQEYENNNAKTVEELRQWAEAKFTHGHIDKLSDKIVVKAFLLDGQSVHIGDTVTLKSSKHDIDIERKCVGYEYDVLSEQYISLTFDDRVPVGSSGGTSGVSNLAETVISVGKTQSDIALDRAIANANRVFDEKFERSAEDLKTGIEVAKAKSEQVKSELESKINAEIKPLANEAKQVADRANQSIANQAEEMEQLRATLADNKREVLAEANQAATNAFNRAEQLLNQSKSTLSGQIAAVSQTLSETKRNLLEQANAQTELSGRVTTVEETANGTKATVTDLQKTVNATTGNLDAVSRRTRTVEDNLSGLTTKIENIRVGGTNLIRGSREMKLASGGWASGAFRKSGNGTVETITVSDSPVVGLDKAIRLTKTGATGEIGVVQDGFTIGKGEYTLSYWVRGTRGQRVRLQTWWKSGYASVSPTITLKSDGWQKISFSGISTREETVSVAYIYLLDVGSIDVMAPKLERGNVATDWSDYDEDYRSELATYKQTVDRNFAELTRTTQTVTDRVTEYKSAFDQTAERFRTSINALEAFKNDEGARESRYLSLSREETARQLQTVRSDITRDYVSKSQLTETTRGIEQRFERLTTGRNLVKNSKIKESSNVYGFAQRTVELEAGKTYLFMARAKKTGGSADKTVRIYLYNRSWSESTHLEFRDNDYETLTRSFTPRESGRYYLSSYWSPNGGDRSGTADVDWYMVTEGDIKPSGWQPHVDDASSELATYKNTVDRQLSELSSTINTNNNVFTTFKNSYERTAQGVTEKLTALEAYKNNEHLRSNAYFEASKSETAKQLQTLRTAISEDYIAKSTYEENAESITRRFEKLNEALSDKVSSSTFKQKADEILGRVQALDGEVMKTSSFTINENGLVLQSGSTFDGRTIASLLTVNDDNIKAITDRMIITPNNENLIHPNFRSGITANKRDTVFPNTHTIDLKNDDEFLIKWKGVRNTSHSFGILLYITYEDSTNDWKFCNFKEKSVSGQNDIEVNFKLTGLRKKVRSWQIGYHISASSNFGSFTVESCEMYKKTSASLIVDGSITGRHIKANSIETGHHKAGSVTTEILGANAVTAEKMLVNQAMINKLMTDDLLARAITASELFATSVQAVDISAARVTSGILASRNGAMTINLDNAAVDFLQEATIRFHSSNNAVKRTKGESTAFIHFSDDSYGGVYAGFGVRGDYGGVNSAPSGKGTFAGVRVFRPNDSLDKIELYGDKIELRHSFSEAGSIYFDHLSVQGKTINLGAVLIALANMWTHYRNMRQRWEHSSTDLRRDYNILSEISSVRLQ